MGGWVAGVDGCRGGFVLALIPARRNGGAAIVRIEPQIEAVLGAPERPAIIAIDLPIGLPDRVGIGGREAERRARKLLGARKSSVFSVPSRAAIAATEYRDACRIARETSDPPRAVSKQLFHITDKIRELDAALRVDPERAKKVFEVHPELAFWRFNGAMPLPLPKKVKNRLFAPGLALRRTLLERTGVPTAALDGKRPGGAGWDDVLDALACAGIARRIYDGIATPIPDPPPCDRHGLRMAMWL